MKKAISILLCVLCVLSCMGVAASAEGPFDELSSMLVDEPIAHYITYQNETLAGVSMMYKPNPTMSFDGPGYVTVTRDVPIAVDHEFVCWRDFDGNLYYEGDKVYVEGEVVLYAVWVEKTDSLPRVLRVIQTALLTLQRMVQKALGLFRDFQDFESVYNASTTTTEAVGG